MGLRFELDSQTHLTNHNSLSSLTIHGGLESLILVVLWDGDCFFVTWKGSHLCLD